MKFIVLYMKFVEKVQWITAQSWWVSLFHEGQRNDEDDPGRGPPTAKHGWLTVIIHQPARRKPIHRQEKCTWNKHVNHLCLQDSDPNYVHEKSDCQVSLTPTDRRSESSSQEVCIWQLYWKYGRGTSSTHAHFWHEPSRLWFNNRG